jgi:beta-lactamase superfamily II metal-dependent hydrolase
MSRKLTMSAEVFILDVGHGSAAVLLVEKTCVVIDAGHSQTVLDFLEDRGVQEIAMLFLSHADADHVSGAQALITSDLFPVRELVANPDATKQTDTWRDLLFAIKEQSRATREGALRVSPVNNRSSAFEFHNIAVEVLAPPIDDAMIGPGGRSLDGAKLDSNSQSIVLRVRAFNTPRILFSGDVTDTAWARMIADGVSPEAEIYVASHHGGRTGQGGAEVASILRDVKPRTVLVSNGRGRHDNPRVEFVRETIAAGSGLMCTQLAEACGPSGNRGIASADLVSRGRKNSACCAGTIRILLHSDRTEIVGIDDHAQFVEASATNALCRLRR